MNPPNIREVLNPLNGRLKPRARLTTVKPQRCMVAANPEIRLDLIDKSIKFIDETYSEIKENSVPRTRLEECNNHLHLNDNNSNNNRTKLRNFVKRFSLTNTASMDLKTLTQAANNDDNNDEDDSGKTNTASLGSRLGFDNWRRRKSLKNLIPSEKRDRSPFVKQMATSDEKIMISLDSDTDQSSNHSVSIHEKNKRRSSLMSWLSRRSTRSSITRSCTPARFNFIESSEQSEASMLTNETDVSVACNHEDAEDLDDDHDRERIVEKQLDHQKSIAKPRRMSQKRIRENQSIDQLNESKRSFILTHDKPQINRVVTNFDTNLSLTKLNQLSAEKTDSLSSQKLQSSSSESCHNTTSAVNFSSRIADYKSRSELDSSISTLSINMTSEEDRDGERKCLDEKEAPAYSDQNVTALCSTYSVTSMNADDDDEPGTMQAFARPVESCSDQADETLDANETGFQSGFQLPGDYGYISEEKNINRNPTVTENSRKGLMKKLSSRKSILNSDTKQNRSLVGIGGRKNSKVKKNISFMTTSFNNENREQSSEKSPSWFNYGENGKYDLIKVLAGTTLFNRKPKDGLNYLIKNSILTENPKQIADFIYYERRLTRQAIGEYFGIVDNDLANDVLKEFLKLINMKSMEVDLALRNVMVQFHPAGESQKISFLMQQFHEVYISQNPNRIGEMYRSSETIEVLAYSILLLHTDLHNPNVGKLGKRMTKQDFINNNRGIDSEKDLPKRLLENIYDRVAESEFKTLPDEIDRLRVLDNILVGPLKTDNFMQRHRRFVGWVHCRQLDKISPRFSLTRSNTHWRHILIFNDILIVVKALSNTSGRFKSDNSAGSATNLTTTNDSSTIQLRDQNNNNNNNGESDKCGENVFHSTDLLPVDTTYQVRNVLPVLDLSTLVFETQQCRYGLQLCNSKGPIINLAFKCPSTRSKLIEWVHQSIAEMQEIQSYKPSKKETPTTDNDIEIQHETMKKEPMEPVKEVEDEVETSVCQATENRTMTMNQKDC